MPQSDDRETIMVKIYNTDHPTSGIFIAWDEEDVTVARLDAGTIHDRTVVVVQDRQRTGRLR
jgi:hypothetical protein